MIDEETREIDGHSYRVVMFPSGAGVKLLLELKRALGSSAGALFGGDIEHAIAYLCGNMSGDEVLNLMLRLLEWTYVDGATEGINRSFFDKHFKGRYGHLFKVLSLAVEVNYADFFAVLKDSMQQGINNLEQVMQVMAGASALNSLKDTEKPGGSTDSPLKEE